MEKGKILMLVLIMVTTSAYALSLVFSVHREVLIFIGSIGAITSTAWTVFNYHKTNVRVIQVMTELACKDSYVKNEERKIWEIKRTTDEVLFWAAISSIESYSNLEIFSALKGSYSPNLLVLLLYSNSPKIIKQVRRVIEWQKKSPLYSLSYKPEGYMKNTAKELNITI